MIWQLRIGTRDTGLTVCQDTCWPGMWRIHYQDKVSDMVNLTRAKDAAVSWVRPRGLGGTEVIHWSHRETPT